MYLENIMFLEIFHFNSTLITLIKIRNRETYIYFQKNGLKTKKQILRRRLPHTKMISYILIIFIENIQFNPNSPKHKIMKSLEEHIINSLIWHTTLYTHHLHVLIHIHGISAFRNLTFKYNVIISSLGT